jgi:oxygen-independent coproporphyrinogen III oxidase
MSGTGFERTAVPHLAALEECFFLGLRLTQGVNLRELSSKFGGEAIASTRAAIAEFVESGLMQQRGDLICLTARGRLLSNEVFERFMVADGIVG